MKGIIIIILFLLLGETSGYTPEQQTILDGMNLSQKLYVSYEKARQDQNVAAYNALVDEYNAWMRQHFGNETSLLKSKLYRPPTATTTSIALTPEGNAYLVTNPFNTSSGLSTFGKNHVYASLPVGSSEETIQNSMTMAEALRFLNPIGPFP